MKIGLINQLQKNAQEAHEAIRPTNIDLNTISKLNELDNKIYKLIWKRTVASQMKSEEIKVWKMIIDISNRKEKFVATTEDIIF